MSRLLFKGAGPVPSLKKRAAPVRHLLNTARYPLKTRYRHPTAYNTEKDSLTVKDPTSHTNTEAMLEYYVMYHSHLREYFCREYFCPPILEVIREIFRSRKFLRRTVCNNGQRVHAFHWKGICGLFLSTALQQMVNVLQINVKEGDAFYYTVLEDKLLVTKNT